MGMVLYRPLGAGLALAALLATLGCGAREAAQKAGEAAENVRNAAERTQRSNQLKMIALAYQNCNDATTKGPANADEFGKYLMDAPDALALVKSGEIVVLWNAKIPQSFPAGTSNTVLIYEKDVPTKGGLVAMGDGSVRTMTAQEFGAAAKPTVK